MQVGILGTGLMGAPLGMRVLAGGHALRVWNRSPEKCAPLAEAGATVDETPVDVVKASEVVVLMLADATAIDAALDGLPVDAWKGRVCLQMGTIAPTESRTLARRVRDAGGDFVEAPVLGSIPEAREGRLIVMVGADSDEDFDRVRPLLGVFGEAPQRVGGIGQASAMKLALNQLIATLTSAFSLSLAFLEREDADVDAFMSLLRTSALYAPTFDKKLGKMQARSFANPNFPLKHLRKDVALFERAAAMAGIPAALLGPIRENLERLGAAGFDDEDYSALFRGFVEDEAPDRVMRRDPG